jgi:hypothetical protein
MAQAAMPEIRPRRKSSAPEESPRSFSTLFMMLASGFS